MRGMANVHDVAAYILASQGEMTTWKLQKLVYYCQAWHLVWEDQPLFGERIEAWSNGPVVRELYRAHRGDFRRRTWNKGDPARLTPRERETIDAVLDFYGDKTGQWLSELTHSEFPWQRARGGLNPTERGSRPIQLDDMAAYYGGLAASAT
jgi:uncharacterized phage-associated protein